MSEAKKNIPSLKTLAFRKLDLCLKDLQFDEYPWLTATQYNALYGFCFRLTHSPSLSLEQIFQHYYGNDYLEGLKRYEILHRNFEKYKRLRALTEYYRDLSATNAFYGPFYIETISHSKRRRLQ